MRVVALVTVVSLASCVGGADNVTSTEMVGSSSLVQSTMTSAAVDEIGSPVPPTLPRVTEDYRSSLGEFAAYVLGDDALVPWGSEEFLVWSKACIESSGFKVEIDNGGVLVEFGLQVAAFREVLAECEDAAVAAGLVMERVPPSAEELGAWYDAYMLSYECLVEHGYTVCEPPSRDVYTNDRDFTWSPFFLIGNPEEVEKDCPRDLVVLFQMMAAGEKP